MLVVQLGVHAARRRACDMWAFIPMLCLPAMLRCAGPEALLCLCPWLAHIGLGPHWEGQQAERLLHLLYRITATQGQRHAYQVRSLLGLTAGACSAHP